MLNIIKTKGEEKPTFILLKFIDHFPIREFVIKNNE